ncbi:hypothetical protein CHS0354_001294 [Potamilus streckersoni]|uniref:Uncharacterized protein n=1 Tax=Potamilus streckersoni TaxID=2493646 RepID=A0AAE0VPL2_9BIVA|nr:hypothetical protein CHS0354_001294 [Potamilus streckersoni]
MHNEAPVAFHIHVHATSCLLPVSGHGGRIRRPLPRPLAVASDGHGGQPGKVRLLRRLLRSSGMVATGRASACARPLAGSPRVMLPPCRRPAALRALLAAMSGWAGQPSTPLAALAWLAVMVMAAHGNSRCAAAALPGSPVSGHGAGQPWQERPRCAAAALPGSPVSGHGLASHGKSVRAALRPPCLARHNYTSEWLVFTDYANHTVKLDVVDCSVEYEAKQSRCLYDKVFFYDGTFFKSSLIVS